MEGSRKEARRKKGHGARLWQCWLVAWLFPALWILAFLGIDLVVRERLGQWIELACAQKGIPLRIRHASWEGVGGWLLEDLSLGNALTTRHLRIRWNLWELLRRKRIALVEADHLVIRPQALAALFPSRPGQHHPADLGSSWVIGQLRIDQGVLQWQGLLSPLGTLTVAMGRSETMVIQEVPLGALVSGGLGLQWVETGRLVLDSPWDPLSPIASVENVRFRFSWGGLARGRIEEVEVLGPTVFLGPDLFWFFEEAKKGQAAGRGSSWTIDRLRIRAGRFVVSAFGAPQLALPFTFESDSKEVALNQLEDISVRGQFVILPGELDYPNYGIHLWLAGGSVGFSLPPGKPGVHNVVQVVRVPRARWKGVEVTDGWVTFTFDPKGIYGETGGKACKGYVKGGFAISFAHGYPWLGWLSLSQLEAGSFCKALGVPSQVVGLEGRANGKLLVQARGLEIQKTELGLSLPRGGTVRVRGIERFSRRIPAHGNPVQTKLAQWVLDSLASYPFDRAEFLVQYGVPETHARMEFWSHRRGYRGVFLHWIQEETKGSWTWLREWEQTQ